MNTSCPPCFHTPALAVIPSAYRMDHGTTSFPLEPQCYLGVFGWIKARPSTARLLPAFQPVSCFTPPCPSNSPCPTLPLKFCIGCSFWLKMLYLREVILYLLSESAGEGQCYLSYERRPATLNTACGLHPLYHSLKLSG